MQTIKIKYTINDNDKLLLNDYIRQYNHVYRVAFNNLQSHKKNKLSKLTNLNNIDLLDSWFIQSANYEVKTLYKLVGDKKVIFGGRKNFIKRCQNKISYDEYNSYRFQPLCSYGEKKSGTKSVHGNRKFKLSDDLIFITLKLKERKIKINLPKYLHSNIKYILKNVYVHQILDDTPITYKIDYNYVYIQFDESVILNKNNNLDKIQNRVLSLDLNPNYIGWSIVDWKSENEFNVIKSGVYSIKNLNDKVFNLKNKGYSSDSSERKYISDKRNFETIQIVKNIVNKSIYYKCQLISIEDLNIKSSDFNKGKRLNKLINNSWCRNTFVNNLTKRCNIHNMKLLKVKPEYSSFIGNFLYRSLNLPDMILASIEIGRRGYEFYNQYISKVKEIKKNIIKPDLNMFNRLYLKSLEEFKLQPIYKDLIELYYFFKKSKMMYRLSIDQFNLQFSSLFSNTSYIGYFCF